ncbi:MAG: anion transporter [Candidatus Accumulibacter sp.]|uniref:SLC13 family permease n=1 Tax=Accumulibacter sp. TaxID=2053492 RepID=UPI001A41AF85|nr:SLC13 family permease [Accumulibacter sp.]MBL8393951.1 anion transporter [Accumulibacter sp.]
MRRLLLIPGAIAARLQRDLLLLILLLLCVGFSLLEPAAVATYPLRVDWSTIAALTGLLLLTTALEESGFLQHLAYHVITRMHSERHLALLLVGTAAAMASVLTNDIALFIVVPLTLGLHGMAALPTARLVIFEALAVNAGSVLTPMGNPQNLFLWHRSGATFAAFVGEMAPLAAILLGTLLLLTLLAFSARPIETHEDITPPPLSRALLWTSLLLYPVFLLLLELRRPWLGLAVVGAIFAAAFRHIWRQVDWALIVVFILMFIDLRLFTELPRVQALVASVGLHDPQRLYLAGVLTSQVISNVPGAILLAEHSGDWRIIAWAVNVGGFGLLIGSLANLIALRLLGQRQAWWSFHAWSLPFLGAIATLAHCWLFWP